ncbi:flagellar assembly protein FliW [Hydrogenoanaerobacterium sp.]|uniref:flagellar assembly protein FliW n=1 Tax=Hydrogenoanaerobacterium sp. TaxID=2953763 RepID=UPI00289F54A7|nr:flagellar assembly protein FliW [Hydrogenoanaerobacterium sp.]
MVKIETRDFGIVEIDEKELIYFSQSVYGFEHLSNYVLLADEAMGESIRWLQSAEDKDVCFIVINPAELFADYAPVIPQEIRLELHAKPGDHLDCWAIAVICPDFKKSTVNLKSPIIINREKMNGVQLILEQNYSIRTPLFDQKKGV